MFSTVLYGLALGIGIIAIIVVLVILIALSVGIFAKGYDNSREDEIHARWKTNHDS